MADLASILRLCDEFDAQQVRVDYIWNDDFTDCREVLMPADADDAAWVS